MSEIKLRVLVVAVAVLAAGLYFHQRSARCELVIDAKRASPAAAGDVAGVSAASTAVDTPIRMILPDASTAAALNLGYAPFEWKPEGWASVVPMPPGIAIESLVSVNAANAGAIKLQLLDERCAAPVDIGVFLPSSSVPLLTGSLSSREQRELVLPLAEIQQADRLLVRVAMSKVAENNYFCNVGVSFEGAR